MRASTALATTNDTIQRARADRDLGADAREPAHQPRLRAGQRPRDHDERRAHRELRRDRAERRPVEPEVQAVDEHQLEDQVRDVRGDHDLERAAQSRDPAQIALTGGREQDGRQARRRDPQVARREVGDVPVPREQRDRGPGERQRHQRSPARSRAPGPATPPARRARGRAPLAAAVGPRDRCGRAVDEEVEHRRDGAERRGRERQRGELGRPEMADDGGVGEQVQRLRRERAERRAARGRRSRGRRCGRASRRAAYDGRA